MAKRTRKERRQKQRTKAVQQGDLGAIRAIVDRNPESGANALIAALESSSSDPSHPEVVLLADQVVHGIRDKGRHDQVMRLAACFPSPSTNLRLARALSAIAIGDDTTATADANADPRVNLFVAPILAALSGSKAPRTPPKAPSLVASIYALCRAVASAHRGSLSPAKKTLSTVAAPQTAHLGVHEMQLAFDLHSGRLHTKQIKALVRRLLASSLVRGHRPARKAIAMTLATSQPSLLLESLDELDLTPEEAAAASVRASLADATLDSEQARISRIIAAVGAAAFPPEHRPVAHIFEGFAIGLAQPKLARACFDAAIAAGADLGEALRGRALTDQREHNDREAAKSFLRLAKLLAHESDGAPLAIQAARSAAMAAAFTSDLRQAREAVALATSVGKRTGLLDPKAHAELLTLESRCWDPDKAGPILDQAMSLDPKSPDVWHARIELAHARGDTHEAEELVLQAGELQLDDEFVMLARQLRGRRGERWTPEPGKATAGELAAELYQRIAQEKDSSNDAIDDLLRCRAELSPTARIAFDMARWASLASFDHDPAATALLRAAWADPDIDQHTRNAWVLLAADYGDPAGVIPLLVERAKKDPNDRILGQGCSLIAEQDRADAEKLIVQLAPLLSRTRLTELRALSRRGDVESAAEQDLLQLLKPYSSALHPHFSFKGLLEGAGPVPKVGGDADLDEDHLLRQLLQSLGAPLDLLDNATPQQLIEARKIARELVVAPSKGKTARLVDRLHDVLEGPENAPSFFF